MLRKEPAQSAVMRSKLTVVNLFRLMALTNSEINDD